VKPLLYTKDRILKLSHKAYTYILLFYFTRCQSTS